jgi:hypothetical protein
VRVARLAFLLTPFLLASSVLTAAPARAADLPTVSITSPIDGSFADGMISVTAIGTDDGAGGDQPLSMHLSVDGGSGPSIDCTGGGSSSCTASFDLDADALSPGIHQVRVAFWTNDAVAVSDVVFIGAHSPSPSIGASLMGSATAYAIQGGGYVELFASAEGWTRQAGIPMSLQLLVDGSPVFSPLGCPASVVGESPCSHGLGDRLSRGSHTVQARLTVGSSTLDSAPLTVTVLAPSVAITSPSPETVVHKSVTVTVVGTAAGPEDSPKSIAIDPNGFTGSEQTAACPDPAAATCTATFAVPVGALSSLTASFTTSHLTVHSPSVPVTTYSTSRMGIDIVPVALARSARSMGGSPKLSTRLGPHPYG